MKILIVDRDEMASQLLSSKLQALGHEVLSESVKQDALETLSGGNFDVVCLDPNPMNSAKPMLMDIRRHVVSSPYVFLLSDTDYTDDMPALFQEGVHDFLAKPFDSAVLEKKLVDAERFRSFFLSIQDTSEDFPSAGGVISKSAFCQLFLSAMDRAPRYGEKTYVLFLTVTNYDDIQTLDGVYGADYAVARVSQHLVLTRRQSDIVGQTAKHQFALLLQRPNCEAEPLEAASRFIASLEAYDLVKEMSVGPVQLSVTLMELPTGKSLVSHDIIYDRYVSV